MWIKLASTAVNNSQNHRQDDRDKLDPLDNLECNKARGVPLCQKFDIIMDNNGQPKPVAVQNSSRVIAGLHCAANLCTNSDTQYLSVPVSPLPQEHVSSSSAPFGVPLRKILEEISNNVVALGMSGIEYNNAGFVMLTYLTAHQCKCNRTVDN